MKGGLRGREGAMGLGRGRMEGWQRGGESSRAGRDIFGGGRSGIVGGGRSGIVGEGRSGIVCGGRDGILDGSRGGIAGSNIDPLTLVAGAKKLFQDVSEDGFGCISAFPPDHANVLTGCSLSHDCTTTNRRPDGSSNAAHDLSRTSRSLITSAMTGK
jgi:hypothetical protein